jgi:hypothetical protein
MDGYLKIPPTEQGCHAMFRKETLLICYGLKQEITEKVQQWMNEYFVNTYVKKYIRIISMNKK